MPFPSHPGTQIPETQFPEPRVPPVDPSPQQVPLMHLPWEEFLVQPGREGLPLLDPLMQDGATWFGPSDNGMTKCIMRMMHNLLKKPHPSFSDMLEEDQELWLRHFAQEFNWRPSITGLVRTEFRRKAGRVYTNHFYTWKRTWLKKGKKAKEMPEGLYDGLVEYWCDPKTAKTADTNKKNRYSDRDGRGIATTNLGAKSTITREVELTRKLGRRPNPLELMADIHTNKKTGEIQDAVAKEVVETSKKIMDEMKATQQTPDGEDLPLDTQYEIVTETTKKSKGRVFGLGNMARYCLPGSRSRDPIRDEEMRRKEAEVQILKEKVDDLVAARHEDQSRMAKMQATMDAILGRLGQS